MRTSDTALLMSFAALLMARYRLDVSAQASEFMAPHSPVVSLADYVGLPVELIGKLRRDGNPAEFLTMQDIDNLVAFIEGQRDVISAQQRRIAQLIEDDGVRRNGARLERENLQKYVASVEAERDRLSDQVERLQMIPHTKTRAEFMESFGVDGMSADKKRLVNAAWDRAEWFFNQQGAALKAQWQAEVVDRCEKEVTASVNVLFKPHIAGVFAVIRQRAQEAGDVANNPKA